jgi:hypothetical protein
MVYAGAGDVEGGVAKTPPKENCGCGLGLRAESFDLEFIMDGNIGASFGVDVSIGAESLEDFELVRDGKTGVAFGVGAESFKVGAVKDGNTEVALVVGAESFKGFGLVKDGKTGASLDIGAGSFKGFEVV